VILTPQSSDGRPRTLTRQSRAPWEEAFFRNETSGTKPKTKTKMDNHIVICDNPVKRREQIALPRLTGRKAMGHRGNRCHH
jgi:hypothetical protein